MRWWHNPFDDITSGKYHSSNLPGQISARINALFMYGNTFKTSEKFSSYAYKNEKKNDFRAKLQN